MPMVYPVLTLLPAPEYLFPIQLSVEVDEPRLEPLEHAADLLEQIGCVFKGFEPGLVDFYGKLDGKEIFWCWKQGEDRIDHWHELETGYAGRQPVPEVVSS